MKIVIDAEVIDTFTRIKLCVYWLGYSRLFAITFVISNL